jgi:hypothetical protein
MQVIPSNESDDGATVVLTDQDLGLINSALNEILHGPDAIAQPEFHTRIGSTPMEAKALLVQLGALINQRRSSQPAE